MPVSEQRASNWFLAHIMVRRIPDFRKAIIKAYKAEDTELTIETLRTQATELRRLATVMDKVRHKVEAEVETDGLELPGGQLPAVEGEPGDDAG